jgi:hypothetical protein
MTILASAKMEGQTIEIIDKKHCCQPYSFKVFNRFNFFNIAYL